jgi:hypothetical protein
MRTILATFSVVLAAAALWQATHCPVQGGACHCSEPSWLPLAVGSLALAFLACLPRKRTVAWI